MKVFLFISLFLIGEIVGSSDWESFKSNHGKRYSSFEEKVRRSRFLQTDQAIVAHNQRHAAGLETYSRSHNKFSDMSDDEKATFLGFRKRSKARTADTTFDATLYDRQLPASYDLRTSKCMPAIKNQGNCGDCWAFATVTPIEYQYCLKKNLSAAVNFSDQQVTDCSYPNYDGCNGGDHHDAWNYLFNAGIMASSAYPFTSGSSGVGGTCKFAACKVVARLANIGTDLPQNETAIQAALVANGPITHAYYVSNNFFSYSTGVFSDATCLKDYNSLNHEMVIVGYGVSGTVPYWIIRNQWDITWGQAGYAFVRRGTNECGIAVDAGYPTVV